MLYIKKINGNDVIKPLKEIVVTKDGMTTICPSEYDVIKDGWKRYTAPEPSLEDIKKEVINRLMIYDSSDDVNSFYIGEERMWLDKATRVGLKLRFEAELRLGKTETTLWQDGIGYTLPLSGQNNAFDMLDGIELYASYCYDNTQAHLRNIKALTTKEEVESYIYKTGYSDKLRF